MKYKANFFDKNSDETRTLTVHAKTEDEAETKAEDEADARQWPRSFKLADVEEIEDDRDFTPTPTH